VTSKRSAANAAAEVTPAIDASVTRGRERVLMVITLAETGGAQTYVRNLLPMLVAHYDVTVAAHGQGPLADATRTAGATYVPLTHVRRPLDPVRDVAGFVELWRLCRRIRPQIVHLNSSKVGILGAAAAALAGVPARVFTAHGWAFNAETGFRARAYRALHRLIRPLLTCVICVSQSELAVGLAAKACVRGRSEVIRNGVPRRPAGSSPRTGIVTVTRLRAPKDIFTLVEAVAQQGSALPRITVVGDGPDRALVEQTLVAKGLSDRFELVGDVGDPGPFLDRAAVFVLSSRSEGLPMAVLEAMAAGLPVVATAVGGIPEVVHDGVSGTLVPPGDAAALGSALSDVASDPDRAAALGASGRRSVDEEYSIERCQGAHRVLYRRLLQVCS
jgi:glycosyltransferase involved in cell wall biosynthesis